MKLSYRNGRSSLRLHATHLDSPCFHLIRTSCEEILQLEGLVPLQDDFVQGTVRTITQVIFTDSGQDHREVSYTLIKNNAYVTTDAVFLP